MLADARPLDGEGVSSGHDIVERVVVVEDRFESPAHIAEHPTDLVATLRYAPFREIDLGVLGEQLEDAAAGLGHAGVVEGLEVLERYRLSLRVCHRLCDRHVSPPSSGPRIERRDCGVDVDPDRLWLGVLAHRLEAHFAAIAGEAGPAERGPGVDPLVAVDPDP